MGLFASAEAQTVSIGEAKLRGQVLSDEKGVYNSLLQRTLVPRAKLDAFLNATRAASLNARALARNTNKAGCCLTNAGLSKFPWTWHQLCQQLQAPKNEGSLMRLIALFASINCDHLQEQLVRGARTGALYLTLERDVSFDIKSNTRRLTILEVCTGVIESFRIAKRLVPTDLVPLALTPISSWGTREVKVFLWYLGYGTPGERFWNTQAQRLKSVDGKWLSDWARQLDSTSTAMIRIYTPPPRSRQEAPGVRAGYQATIRRLLKDINFQDAAGHDQTRPRVLAKAVCMYVQKTMPIVQRNLETKNNGRR
mmetsp:Transcript_11461/g.17130  ORF Transcript_11461/g.17130 Transcript_11461/m.17130 type:complete len:310 (+) Transcript_11461:40-969(+)